MALFLFSCPLFANSSLDPYWKKILWYEGDKGLVSEKSFYLSPSGNIDPKKELDESLRRFKTNEKFGSLKLPANCAYPLRWKYLNKIEPLPKNDSECEEFYAWKNQLAVKKVSIVFAGYYSNNPASIFGHTFLKLHGPQDERLLDYGVNFAAITEKETGLFFGLKGLFGYYKGFFNIAPYFLKVNEYSNGEGRDLFEYELNLTPDEIDRLLDAIWEIGNNGSFDYYFLGKNCSYYLLRLLDLARIDSHLADDYHYITIPSETMKTIEESKMIALVKSRASLDREINETNKKLGPDNNWTKVKVAQFKKQTLKNWNEEEKEELHHLLIEQSKMKVTEVIVPQLKHHPAQTHGPMRLELGAGEINKKFGTQFKFKPASHDLIDPPQGHLPYSKMELLSVTLRSTKSNELNLQNFTLIDTSSFTPWKYWSRRLSWRGELSHQQNEISVNGRRLDKILSGAGISFELSEGLVTSFLLTGHFDFSNHFAQGYAFNLDPEWIILGTYEKFSFLQKFRFAQRWEKTKDQQFFESTEEFRYSLGDNDWIRAELLFYHQWDNKKFDQAQWNVGWVRAF